MNEKINPLLLNFVEKNNIGDNVVLFYFASIIREMLRSTNDEEMNNAISEFIFSDKNEEI